MDDVDAMRCLLRQAQSACWLRRELCQRLAYSASNWFPVHHLQGPARPSISRLKHALPLSGGIQATTTYRECGTHPTTTFWSHTVNRMPPNQAADKVARTLGLPHNQRTAWPNAAKQVTLRATATRGASCGRQGTASTSPA